MLLYIKWASHVVLVVKNPPANERNIRYLGLILGQEDPLEEVMATHSIILVWRIHSQRSLLGYSLKDHRVR